MTNYCQSIKCYGKVHKLIEVVSDVENTKKYVCESDDCDNVVYVSTLDKAKLELDPESYEEATYERIASERVDYSECKDMKEETALFNQTLDEVSSTVTVDSDEFESTREELMHDIKNEFITNHCQKDDDDEDEENDEDEDEEDWEYVDDEEKD